MMDHYVSVGFWLSNMHHLPSKSLSTETLVRGANLLRSQTMSMESDAQYAEMVARRNELLETW